METKEELTRKNGNKGRINKEEFRSNRAEPLVLQKCWPTYSPYLVMPVGPVVAGFRASVA